MLVAPIPQALELVRSGQLRALGGDHGQARWSRCRTCPPSASSCRATRRIGWYGLGVPKDTPAEIVNKLNEPTNKALADPKLKARLADLGVEPMPMTPAGVQQRSSVARADKWTKVIRIASRRLVAEKPRSSLDHAFADDDASPPTVARVERAAAMRQRQMQQARPPHLVALLDDDVVLAVAEHRTRPARRRRPPPPSRSPGLRGCPWPARTSARG